MQGNIHSKVAILRLVFSSSTISVQRQNISLTPTPNYSLRCQSLIYLKLYKIRRHDFKDVQRTITEYNQKPNQPVSADIVNGNTPSPLSPTSVGSQVSFAKPKDAKTLVILKLFRFVSSFLVAEFRLRFGSNRRPNGSHSGFVHQFFPLTVLAHAGARKFPVKLLGLLCSMIYNVDSFPPRYTWHFKSKQRSAATCSTARIYGNKQTTW